MTEWNGTDSAVSDQIPANSVCGRGVGHSRFIKGENFFTICIEVISLWSGILYVYLVNP